MAFSGRLPRSEQPGTGASAGCGTAPPILERRGKTGDTPQGDLPAPDTAAGAAHISATPVRRVPSDWQLSEPSEEQAGTLEKLTHLYRSPDIKTLGITLDVPKGLVVKEAGGAVQVAGMKPGDRITGLNGTLVWTFGDLQYVYDKVDRKATRIQIAVDRNGEPAVLEITLPPRWWWTDLRFRQSSVEARTHFEDRALTDEEKRKFGFKPEGFASQVKYVADLAKVMKTHDLRVAGVHHRRSRRSGKRRGRRYRRPLHQASKNARRHCYSRCIAGRQTDANAAQNFQDELSPMIRVTGVPR